MPCTTSATYSPAQPAEDRHGQRAVDDRHHPDRSRAVRSSRRPAPAAPAPPGPPGAGSENCRMSRPRPRSRRRRRRVAGVGGVARARAGPGHGLQRRVGDLGLRRRPAPDRQQRRADRPDVGDHQRGLRPVRDPIQRRARPRDLMGERLAAGEREAVGGRLEGRESAPARSRRRSATGQPSHSPRSDSASPSSTDTRRARSPRRRSPRSCARGAAASDQTSAIAGSGGRRGQRLGLPAPERRERRIATAQDQAVGVVGGLAVPGQEQRRRGIPARSTASSAGG